MTRVLATTIRRRAARMVCIARNAVRKEKAWGGGLAEMAAEIPREAGLAPYSHILLPPGKEGV